MGIKLDPEKYHIGVTTPMVAIIKNHPIGKLQIVQEHPHYEGGNVLSVSREEYARISSFCSEVGAIAAAVHKAYS